MQGDDILKFWEKFLSIFPRKIGLTFVTENLTTFFTARKEICHLELTLGASSPNKNATISVFITQFELPSWLENVFIATGISSWGHTLAKACMPGIVFQILFRIREVWRTEIGWTSQRDSSGLTSRGPKKAFGARTTKASGTSEQNWQTVFRTWESSWLSVAERSIAVEIDYRGLYRIHVLSFF